MYAQMAGGTLGTLPSESKLAEFSGGFWEAAEHWVYDHRVSDMCHGVSDIRHGVEFGTRTGGLCVVCMMFRVWCIQIRIGRARITPELETKRDVVRPSNSPCAVVLDREADVLERVLMKSLIATAGPSAT